MRTFLSKPQFGYSLIFFLLFTFTPQLVAADTAITGHVTDALGASIFQAQIELLQDSRVVGQEKSDGSGNFEFSAVAPGRYNLRASAAGFMTKSSEVVIVRTGRESVMNMSLSIGPITEEIVVSASGLRLPEAQVAASVSAVSQTSLEQKLNAFDAMRLASGIQGVQSGGQGAQAAIFIRGGNSTSNKVLIDGVPANDIGGSFEYANLSSAALESVEIFRGPNSVLYGSDAISGVVNVNTRRGITPIPELTISSEGGTFSTMRNEGALAGTYKSFDYLSDLSRTDSRNNVANGQYHNATYAGNYGWTPNATTDLRLTVRRNASNSGLTNAVDLYGISDDSFLKEQNTFLGATLQNQTTTRWHNLLRYAASRLTLLDVNPSPTGTAFDPFGFGPNYIGQPVTLCSPAGCTPAGQAILDFGGTYPSLFDSMTNRDHLQVQTDYTFNGHLTALAAFRFENERGVTHSSFSQGHTSRRNYSYTLQEQSNLWTRFYSTIGLGLENNAIFGFAATPKVSLAYYLARPSSNGVLAGTKLKFNFGRGIKEPSIFDENSSLFTLLAQIAPQLIPQFQVKPSGPERSRSFDFGLEQGLWERRARIAVTLFHNRYYDQIEFVDKTLLPQLGVPAAVASALNFGADVNSADYSARGAETELQLDLSHGFSARASYTFTSAVVTKSFSSDNLFPAINPAFPTTPIGAFSPLVGSRPFRIAPHVGSFSLDYFHAKFNVALDGYLTSSRDDSTFLTDSFFGNSLLLPNRNLDGAYQKLDLTGSYDLRPSITLFTRIENLLNERYDAAYGFPSLPLTVRAGVKVVLGGERRRPK